MGEIIQLRPYYDEFTAAARRLSEPKRKTPLKRSTKPIARRTPLKRSTTPLRRQKPIKVTGARHKRHADFMAACKAKVMDRAQGVCEIGGEPGALEWHHAFGRSIGIPGATRWLHLPEMTLGICHVCHRNWHDEQLFGVNVKDLWQHLCITKLISRYDPELINHEDYPSGSPLAVAKWAIGLLIKEGMEPTC